MFEYTHLRKTQESDNWKVLPNPLNDNSILAVNYAMESEGKLKNTVKFAKIPVHTLS